MDENNEKSAMSFEEFVDGLFMNRTKSIKQLKPLLTKNEYLALELTKIYVGQNMTALMATTIAEKYEYFLGRFNKETET